jgi:glycosyltransferase involved in cell wall biosynthesis
VEGWLARTPLLWRLNRWSLRVGPRSYAECWRTTRRAARRALRRHRPVIAISEYAHFADCLRDAGTALKVIDTVEVFQRDRDTRQELGFKVPISAAREVRALNRADVVVAIQPNDAAVLRQLAPRVRVVTVGLASTLAVHREEPTPGSILYVASSNPYNRQGLNMLLNQAWPSIVGARPDARLHVVGGVATPGQPTPSGVTIHGYVADDVLADLYATASVVVNPQVAGTGLKTKCVEALSAGCAVVTNRAGADGLEDGAGWAFLVAENWEQFTAHVVRLLGDAPYRRQLESGAVEFARRRFDPTRLFDELDALLMARLARHRSPARLRWRPRAGNAESGSGS